MEQLKDDAETVAYLRQALETARALHESDTRAMFRDLYVAALTGLLASDRGYANVMHGDWTDGTKAVDVVADNAHQIATAALARWEKGEAK